MSDTQKQTDAAATIRELATRHNVRYEPTATDRLAKDISRLSGDDVDFDEVERLLIALQRAGYLSRADAVLLQAKYLRQAGPAVALRSLYRIGSAPSPRIRR